MTQHNSQVAEISRRGIELRGVLLDFFNSAMSKEEVIRNFIAWENAPGTKFILPVDPL